MQFVGAADERAIAKGATGSSGVIVQEYDTLETPGATGSVKNYLSVSTSTPDH
jgi:hypothetical protein